ncbi:CapA family protein [Rhodococcus sp. NPDC058521]|uniref:CapA family protein n=1 Tax=Rhodococcus sp. NPDC058521 TaxID=3346536 RepID=UPI00365C5366
MNTDEHPRFRWRRWALPTVATGIVLGIAVTAVVQMPDTMNEVDAGNANVVRGTVVDETGKPVSDASVNAAGELVRSEDDGTFELPLDKPALAVAESGGHLPRTQAVAPGEDARIELTSGADTSMALRFGGDVMFGRHYYEKTDEGPPLLGKNADPAQHADLLSGVAPLLQDSDLSVVNLESPLIDDPYYPENGPRPPEFHPTKKSAFASATESAEALRMSGVDVVSIANDHAFDALDAGVASTVGALDKAGVAHFGAGRNEDEAWAPAIVPRENGTVAFVGCTTVDGDKNPIPYVAEDDRGGAAECSTKKIERAVRSARGKADTVVFMIHGGNQHERQQSPTVRRMSDAAARAGAAIVVGGHPQVTGGIRTVGESVIAESTGNLLYDQPLWSSAPSQLLRVDVRGGKPVHTSSDPLMIEQSRPVPVVGALADSASRIAAGSVPGAARLSGPGAEIAAGPSARTEATDVSLQPGVPRRLAPGRFVDGSVPGVRLGSDLLWGSGRFEDQDTDPASKGVNLWDLGQAARTTTSAACADSRDRDPEEDGTPNGKGLELVRSPKSTEDVYATPGRRVGVTEGQQVSLVADVRSASPGSQLELRWYNGFSGRSVGADEIVVPEGDRSRSDCTQVRVDAVVPPGAVAAQPFVRLSPPDDSLSGPRLAVDDVRLVAWAPDGTAGRVFDTVETTQPGSVRVSSDRADDSGPLVGNGAGTE